MAKYDHRNVPKGRLGRQKQFVEHCKEFIKEWPKGSTAAVSFTGGKFKNFHFVEHHHGLSYSWTVCTKKMWLAV